MVHSSRRLVDGTGIPPPLRGGDPHRRVRDPEAGRSRLRRCIRPIMARECLATPEGDALLSVTVRGSPSPPPPSRGCRSSRRRRVSQGISSPHLTGLVFQTYARLTGADIDAAM
ncbi:MAG: hypothetical protein QMD46_10905 [Methanomicrobiales archaeon]|nr:hypothetical protein [Methanomicrobiales archaeon]